LDACPFCHTAIPEDVARFGGKCPSCFAHVPGEEAATDPGTHGHDTHDAHAPKGPMRFVLPALITLASAGLVAAAAWVMFKPAPVATVLDFDDAGYAVGDLQFVAYVEPPPEPVVAPRPRVRPAAASAGVADPSPESGDAVADAAALEAPVEPEPAVASGAQGLSLDVSVAVSRRATQGVRLTDDGAIVEMIKGVLTAESPKLKSCYEQRLKTREDLAGRWMLSLVVTRDGRASSVGVTGLDVADADLEACIVKKVTEWSFQPIRADQPIQKTLGFTSGF